MTVSNFDLTPEAIARRVLELVFGANTNDELIQSFANQLIAENLTAYDLLQRAMLSNQGLARSCERILQNHGHFIHAARVASIRNSLPCADTIIDLGGANAPLYMMGYDHSFKKLTLIDLPAEDRHAMYSEIVVRPPTDGGEVVIQYSDMTSLVSFSDNSVDLVWAGQSIEHVPEEAAVRMVAEAFRVVKPGGIFALDTPNGLITSLHAATAGLSVVHPEHYIEYTPAALASILVSAGFHVEKAFGTNHMPETKRTGSFQYSDFVYGAPISQEIEACYSQFYILRKPLSREYSS